MSEDQPKPEFDENETAKKVLNTWAQRVKLAQAVVRTVRDDDIGEDLNDEGVPTVGEVLQAMSTYEIPIRLVNLHHMSQENLLQQQAEAFEKAKSGIVQANGGAVPPGLFGKGKRRQ